MVNVKLRAKACWAVVLATTGCAEEATIEEVAIESRGESVTIEWLEESGAPGLLDEFVVIESLDGARAPFDVRAPWMMRGLQASWWFADTDRRHFGATTNGADRESTDAQVIAQRILDDVQPGTIVLLHDGGHDSLAADRSATVGATEILLRTLAAQGYRFVSVRELLEQRRRDG